MRLIRLTTLLLVLLLGTAAAATAQKAPKAAPDPIKFGQLDARDLTAAPFAPDSAAPAVVLCDFGTTRFEGHGAGLRLVFERTTRIKILRKAGYEYATVQIPLYHKDDQSEELGRLRGFTYNLDEAGKVRKTPLAETNTFLENRTGNVKVRKFTMPDVREGSVVEYSYVLRSDFLFNLQDWTFQRDIPTRWSEYRTTIPGFYRYKIIRQTYQPFTVFEERIVPVSLSIEEKVAEGSLAVGKSLGQMSITAQAVESRWVMKDLPAFREESFTTTAEDYLVRVNFELAAVQENGENFRDVSNTWPKINAQLLEHENFGRQLERAGFLKEPMQALAAKYPDPVPRAAAVREAIMQSVRYDGRNGIYAENSLKKAFDAHRGSSAEVNLLLLAALRAAGLPAQPVLLSTRDHGQVSRDFPLLEKFNYVVALLEQPFGTPPLLLDATAPLLPSGTLPARCLNRTGRLIAAPPAEGRWIDLTPAQRHVYFRQAQLTLAADGRLSGTVREEHGGYAAAAERTQLTELGEKKYLAAQTATLTAAFPGATVPTATIGGRTDLDRPLQVSYTFGLPAEDGAGAAGAAPDGPLYFSPFAVLGLAANPFSQTERQLPVDFGAAREETDLVTLTLPAGYELAETPKDLLVALPNDGGRYTFGIVRIGAAVQLASRLTLRKAVYSAAEYAYLRDLYQRMLTKRTEKLIIKKKA